MKTINLLLFFLSFGALGGGLALIIDPSGVMIGMPLSLLDTSIFSDFLIPGIILFSVLGLFPVFLLYFLKVKPRSRFMDTFNIYKDFHWVWTFIIYTACALILWIVIEVLIIGGAMWAHLLYVVWALAIILLAFLPQVRERFRNGASK